MEGHGAPEPAFAAPTVASQPRGSVLLSLPHPGFSCYTCPHRPLHGSPRSLCVCPPSASWAGTSVPHAARPGPSWDTQAGRGEWAAGPQREEMEIVALGLGTPFPERDRLGAPFASDIPSFGF